jgi:tRNA (guanine-N7-)-methyltransferase
MLRRPGRRAALGEALASIRVELPETGRLDPLALFAPPVTSVRLEIGFGAGEHLEAAAAAAPSVGFLGVEPFLPGVARLAGAVAARGLANVRIVVDDARLVLDALPDGSLAAIDVLFPDPWPKARHHKRRIVNPATVARFAALLRPGGVLHCATDDPGYQHWMLAALLAEPRLTWLARSARDWHEPPPGHVETRYERKARAAGRRPLHLRFARR